jgi:hypothetical protein
MKFTGWMLTVKGSGRGIHRCYTDDSAYLPPMPDFPHYADAYSPPTEDPPAHDHCTRYSPNPWTCRNGHKFSEVESLSCPVCGTPLIRTSDL